jgi:uncharacterized membrane protein YoaK (UPF0700 family)
LPGPWSERRLHQIPVLGGERRVNASRQTRRPDLAAVVVMALAMGVQNGVFEGESGISALTYVTGALINTGQQVIAVLFGGSPDSLIQHLSLWVGLVCGAVAGSWIWTALGLSGIWIAAGAALLLSDAAARLDHDGVRRFRLTPSCSRSAKG